ncbi:hypothetical protein OROGR_005395 [Orobanche gracilis]
MFKKLTKGCMERIELQHIYKSFKNLQGAVAPMKFSDVTEKTVFAIPEASIALAFIPTGEEILTSLEAEASKEGDAWIVPFLKGLERSSPMKEADTVTIPEERVQDHHEYSLDLISGDVYEGFRAVTIDKDNAPMWDPLTLEGVDAGKIRAGDELDSVFGGKPDALGDAVTVTHDKMKITIAASDTFSKS